MSSNAPDAPGLAELGEAARAKALLRWRVLRPHLEDGVALVHAAREAGVSERTHSAGWRATAPANWWASPLRGAPIAAVEGCPTSSWR